MSALSLRQKQHTKKQNTSLIWQNKIYSRDSNAKTINFEHKRLNKCFFIAGVKRNIVSRCNCTPTKNEFHKIGINDLGSA